MKRRLRPPRAHPPRHGWLATTLAATALCLALAACGSSVGDPAPPHKPAIRLNFSTHNNDRDNDGDHNDDDEKVLDYGHPADAADRRSSVALVTRYFTAAAAGDGAAGCPMLVPFIAESLPEDDGHSPGLQGRTCAVVLSKLFRRNHAQLAMKQATLKVTGVRVAGNGALVVLDFPTIPEVRQMTERRVDGRWWLLTLLDGILE